MSTSCYFHSRRISFTWDHPFTGQAVGRLLAYFGVPSVAQGPADIHIEIRTSDWRPAEAHSGRKALVYQNGVEGYFLGNGVLFQHGVCTASISQPGVDVLVRVDENALEEESGVAGSLFNVLVMSLLLSLRTQHLFPLHAAGLERDGVGICIIACSDSGKSTLSYVLTREGWKYLTDDALLLWREAGDLSASAFRSRFTLDESAMALFPELTSLPAVQMVPGGKKSVDLEQLLPGSTCKQIRPELLLFPRITGDYESRIEPITADEAFRAVMEQSPYFQLDPGPSIAHFETIKELLVRTSHFRFLAGKDVLENPAAVSSLLSGLIESVSVPYEPVLSN